MEILEKLNYHIILSKYFSHQPLFFDGEQQKKSNIRKCVEFPFQQTKAELWDEVTDTLCNLEFIQAKAVAKMTYDLVNDFNNVLEVIPDNAENIRQEKARQARMEKYTRDLIACAKEEIKELEIPEAVPLRTEQEINSEIERIKTNPTRLDRLNDFNIFLGQEAGNLDKYAREIPYFTTQQAWNYSGNGNVGKASEHGSPKIYKNFILRTASARKPYNPFPQVLKTLNGHTDRVSSVSITPDGKYAVTGSVDKKIILWDLSNGKAINKLEGHTDSINSVSVTPDFKKLLSSSYDSLPLLWDLTTGSVFTALKGYTTSVNDISITPDCKSAILDSYDNTCLVWDLKSDRKLYTLRGHKDYVNSVSISANGLFAVSGAMDNLCILWDLVKGEALKVLNGHQGWVNVVSITPDGKFAISGSEDNTCILWNLTTGEVKHLTGHTSGIIGLSTTPDGKRAISGSKDKTFIVWDLSTGKAMKIFNDHRLSSYAFSINSLGNRVIIGSNEGQVLYLNLNVCDIPNNQKEKYQSIRSIFVSSTGKLAMSGSWDKICTIWNLIAEKRVTGLKGHSSSVEAVAITPDEKLAISASLDTRCIVWDIAKRRAVKILKGHREGVHNLIITPDGKHAISGSEDGVCKIWDLEMGILLKSLKGPPKITGFKLLITPDSKTIIYDSVNFNSFHISLWNLITGKKLKILKGHKSNIIAIDLSPDSKRVITGSWDCDCILWDIKTGKPLKILKGHNDGVNFVSILPNGKYAISCSYDNTIIIWDLDDGSKVGRIAFNEAIKACTYSTCFICIGDSYGKTFKLNINRQILYYPRSFISIRQIWDFNLHQYLPLSADCPLCGHRFSASASVLATIEDITKKAGLRPDQSPCLELPDEAWEDPGLLGNCPRCGAELKFNPFIAGGDF